MRKKSPIRAPVALLFVCVVLALLAGIHPDAAAQPAAVGAATFNQAREAWQGGDIDVAEPLYKAALDAGGLSPADVLDAYVHIGAARTVLNRPGPALEAFRIAAVLDPKFKVPPEAGKKAQQLADQARREKAKSGTLTVSGEAPATARPAQTFAVQVTLSNAFVGLVTKVNLSVRDPLTGKTHVASEAPAETLSFEVPSSVVISEANLHVRVDAVDAHENRLASAEDTVRVGKAEVISGDTKSTGKTDTKPQPPKKSKSFWATPWPYIFGGTVLAGGAAALYITTRHDDVAVGVPRVQTVR